MPANTLVPFISEKDKRFFVNTMDGSVSRGISLLELMVQTTQPANSCMNGRKAKQTAFVGQRPSGFSCTCLVGEIKSLDATPFPVLNYFDRPLAITLGKALLLCECLGRIPVYFFLLLILIGAYTISFLLKTHTDLREWILSTTSRRTNKI